MKKKIEKGTEEFVMFSDFYKIIQDYYIVENSDKFFEEVKEKMDEFHKKYQNIPIAKHLAIAILDNLAEQERGMTNGAT